MTTVKIFTHQCSWIVIIILSIFTLQYTVINKCTLDTWVDVCFRFVREFFNDPRRGYGSNVIDVFYKLRGQKFKDPFGPAKEQFDGSGSLGNGGAMRVAPIALFYCNNYDELINISKQSAYITHTNKLGYDGAVLQVK